MIKIKPQQQVLTCVTLQNMKVGTKEDLGNVQHVSPVKLARLEAARVCRQLSGGCRWAGSRIDATRQPQTPRTGHEPSKDKFQLQILFCDKAAGATDCPGPGRRHVWILLQLTMSRGLLVVYF